MDWIPAVLRQIRPAPHMFLGKWDVDTLDVYLYGYLAARLDMGLEADWTFLDSFYGWLSAKTGKRSHLGWRGLIQDEDPSAKNIATFYARLDEFLRETGRPPLGPPIFPRAAHKRDLGGEAAGKPASRCGDHWLVNELRRLEKHPAMYLGEDTVNALQLYLNGVMRGRVLCGESGGDDMLQEFAAWMREQDEFQGVALPAALGWRSIIESLDDGAHNIRTFYRFFRRFLTQIGSREP